MLNSRAFTQDNEQTVFLQSALGMPPLLARALESVSTSAAAAHSSAAATLNTRSSHGVTYKHASQRPNCGGCAAAWY